MSETINETTDEIESELRHKREDLSKNLHELEQKVKSAADWRHHYEKSPGLFIGAALGAGALLALATRGRPTEPARRPVGQESLAFREAKEKGPLNESLNVIRGALIGLAADHAKNFLSQLLPGFEAQLPPHERPGSSNRAQAGSPESSQDDGSMGIG